MRGLAYPTQESIFQNIVPEIFKPLHLLDEELPRFNFDSDISDPLTSRLRNMIENIPKRPFRDIAFLIDNPWTARRYMDDNYTIKSSVQDFSGFSTSVLGNRTDMRLLPRTLGQTEQQYLAQVQAQISEQQYYSNQQRIPPIRIPLVVKQAWAAVPGVDKVAVPASSSFFGYDPRLRLHQPLQIRSSAATDKRLTCPTIDDVSFFEPFELVEFVIRTLVPVCEIYVRYLGDDRRNDMKTIRTLQFIVQYINSQKRVAEQAGSSAKFPMELNIIHKFCSVQIKRLDPSRPRGLYSGTIYSTAGPSTSRNAESEMSIKFFRLSFLLQRLSTISVFAPAFRDTAGPLGEAASRPIGSPESQLTLKLSTQDVVSKIIKLCDTLNPARSGTISEPAPRESLDVLVEAVQVLKAIQELSASDRDSQDILRRPLARASASADDHLFDMAFIPPSTFSIPEDDRQANRSGQSLGLDSSVAARIFSWQFLTQLPPTDILTVMRLFDTSFINMLYETDQSMTTRALYSTSTTPKQTSQFAPTINIPSSTIKSTTYQFCQSSSWSLAGYKNSAFLHAMKVLRVKQGILCIAGDGRIELKSLSRLVSHPSILQVPTFSPSYIIQRFFTLFQRLSAQSVGFDSNESDDDDMRLKYALRPRLVDSRGLVPAAVQNNIKQLVSGMNDPNDLFNQKLFMDVVNRYFRSLIPYDFDPSDKFIQLAIEPRSNTRSDITEKLRLDQSRQIYRDIFYNPPDKIGTNSQIVDHIPLHHVLFIPLPTSGSDTIPDTVPLCQNLLSYRRLVTVIVDVRSGIMCLFNPEKLLADGDIDGIIAVLLSTGIKFQTARSIKNQVSSTGRLDVFPTFGQSFHEPSIATGFVDHDKFKLSNYLATATRIRSDYITNRILRVNTRPVANDNLATFTFKLPDGEPAITVKTVDRMSEGDRIQIGIQSVDEKWSLQAPRRTPDAKSDPTGRTEAQEQARVAAVQSRIDSVTRVKFQALLPIFNVWYALNFLARKSASPMSISRMASPSSMLSPYFAASFADPSKTLYGENGSSDDGLSPDAFIAATRVNLTGYSASGDEAANLESNIAKFFQVFHNNFFASPRRAQSFPREQQSEGRDTNQGDRNRDSNRNLFRNLMEADGDDPLPE